MIVIAAAKEVEEQSCQAAIVLATIPVLDASLQGCQVSTESEVVSYYLSLSVDAEEHRLEWLVGLLLLVSMRFFLFLTFLILRHSRESCRNIVAFAWWIDLVEHGDNIVDILALCFLLSLTYRIEPFDLSCICLSQDSPRIIHLLLSIIFWQLAESLEEVHVPFDIDLLLQFKVQLAQRVDLLFIALRTHRALRGRS